MPYQEKRLTSEEKYGKDRLTGARLRNGQHVSDRSPHRRSLFFGIVYRGSAAAANDHHRRTNHVDNYDWPNRNATILKYNDNRGHAVSVETVLKVIRGELAMFKCSIP
jgi:hypothetical protein